MLGASIVIYFDHAATTPIDAEVRKTMCTFLNEKFGNPSSIYGIGREAKEALENARSKAAEILGAESREIVFTSGATESNNLAIKGVFFYASQKMGIKPHLVISSIEHHCVLDAARYLEENFEAEVTFIGVNKEGIVDPDEIKGAIKENTVLVSIMSGNNEVGSLQPIAEIGKVIKEANTKRASQDMPTIYFHTDAVQTFQYFKTDVDEMGVDLLSLTAHKFYGPKGVGLLYIRKGTKILPQQQGGAQESRWRAGTENVPYIVGMTKAMELADKHRNKKENEVAKICDYLIERVSKEIPETELLGPKEVRFRLPHIAAFIFRRVEGESILINLDMVGVAASSGSACTSGSLEPSHVTKAMGLSDLEAHGAIRFSAGSLNKKEDVDELMKHLPKIIKKLRDMSPIEKEEL
jgi:cysteine desulfurase